MLVNLKTDLSTSQQRIKDLEEKLKEADNTISSLRNPPLKDLGSCWDIPPEEIIEDKNIKLKKLKIKSKKSIDNVSLFFSTFNCRKYSQ